MMSVLFAWFPVIDVPFPLIVLGGVILAIASNRTPSPSSIKEANRPQSADSGTDSPMPGGQNQCIDQSKASASPSLPNLVEKRDPSSQRPISPTISPTHGSQNEHKATGVTSAGAKQSSQSTDPQLPTFISPTQNKKKGVSFTIENQD